jgi:hypothetical protein
MELECVISLKWLGRLVEDRVDGITEDDVMGLATQSGGCESCSGEMRWPLGRNWAADQRKPWDTTGH